MRWDALWVNVHLATMAEGAAGYGEVRDGALGIAGGRIVWVGPRAGLPDHVTALSDHVIDGKGCWLTPGLIDCHTHAVFGGNRAGEFAQRLEGASYEEIARAGGGIVSTVSATRQAREEDLVQSAARRLLRLSAEGVTTVEIKSGYGLDVETEVKMLKVARQLGTMLPLTVVTTFLGAHALPPDYRERSGAYIDLVVNEMLPKVQAAGLADAVDAFCEGIAFSPEEVDRVFTAARAAGLPVKLHADQLSNLGGAALAARHGALSADHLEYTDQAGVDAMAAAGTVAVILPGAFYTLGETRKPPVDAFREAGVPMALATDCNPGSSPMVSILLAMNMGCTLFGLTPAEALAGITRNGARALGLAGRKGVLSDGADADLALWDIDEVAELAYWVGANPCVGVVRGGKLVADFAGFGGAGPQGMVGVGGR